MEKEIEGTLFQKVVIVLTLSFVLKLLFSCTTYQDPVEINYIEYDYNQISVTGIDNSDRYLDYNSTIDSIFSDAVAFKLTLSDSSGYYSALFFPDLMKAFSFQALKAEQNASIFIPRNKVVAIKVKTRFDINDTIKSGDDITEHILCSTSPSDFDLYHTVSQGISWLNDVGSDDKSGSIILVLKASVGNTKAQFEVEVTLDNGNELSGTTTLFTVI